MERKLMCRTFRGGKRSGGTIIRSWQCAIFSRIIPNSDQIHITHGCTSLRIPKAFCVVRPQRNHEAQESLTMHRARLPLNKRDFDVFHESGILYVESFYESADIIEIQKGVHNLFGIIISTHRLPIEQEPFSPATFDSGIEFLRRDYRP